MPKTGGTTLHHLLAEQFSKSDLMPERFNNIRKHPAGALAKHQFFSGHFDYSSVRLIPGEKNVITILRDPVQRLISLYYFVKSHNKEYVEKRNLTLAIIANQCNSIEEFFTHEVVRTHRGINNTMVRLLSTGENSDLSTSHLDQAFDVLSSFTSFGIMEKYDNSVELIFDSLGFTKPKEIKKRQVLDNIVQTNPLLKKIEKEPVTDNLISIIEDLVKLDIELYQKGLALFDHRYSLLVNRG